MTVERGFFGHLKPWFVFVLLVERAKGSLNPVSTPSNITDETFNAWAITFGIGFQLLDQRYIDSGFGKRVAIRCIDPTKLQSITKVTLDDRSKTDRSSIPSGATLRGFGFEEIGELATRLIAEGKINNIGAPDKNVTVRGADSLSMPLSKIPTKIVENLNYIKELLKQKPVTDELALLEKISQVPNKNKQWVRHSCRRSDRCRPVLRHFSLYHPPG